MNMPSSAPTDAVSDAIAEAGAGRDLTREVAGRAFTALISGTVPDERIRDLLLALRAKGESASEIAGAALALRGAMLTVACSEPERLVDTCGTGGGAFRTNNLSTAAAFVVAGAGVPVAKHGNRSYTSRSGSADVLEALGVAIDLPPERSAAVLAGAGIAFLFAPTHHPAMRHVAKVRRELGVATVMNLVGPLSNPAGATRQVIGVAERSRGPTVAQALVELGARHALVVHGEIGIDEVSPKGRTLVWEVCDGRVAEWVLDPASYGLAVDALDGIEGGEPTENAAAMQALFERPAEAATALRSAVVLNAAVTLMVSDMSPNLGEAVALARESLESGAAARRLAALRAASVNTSG